MTKTLRTVAALAATLWIPQLAGAQTVAITGARVHPVSGPVIENGTVVMRNGKIVAIGANIPIPEGATRIDGSGKWVTPGLVSPTTSLGVTEIGQIAGTLDTRATGQGDGVTPSFRVWDGFNPASPMLQVTRNDGITTIGVLPQGGLIGGMGAVIALKDGPLSSVLLKGPALMVGNISASGPNIGSARGEVFARLREVLAEAQTFSARKASYERGASRSLAARAVDLEALQPVLRGTLPMAIAADRATDIATALEIAKAYGIQAVIGGATEGWKVADQLKGVFVLVGALNNIPRDFSTLGVRQDNAALLHQAGARVVITSNDGFFARNVRYEAGVAVSFGMPWDAALRAITLTPAELFGLAKRMGSLEAGKDATLVLWSGDPFEPMTRAERVWVEGSEVQGPSRQDELMRRYRTLPPDYRKQP